MTYEFNPLSDEQLDKAFLMDDGIYDFVVKKADHKISSSGNHMAQLILEVYGMDGNKREIYDYLVFSSANLCIRKVKHFCEAVGLEEDYKKGKLSEHLEGLGGKVEIGYKERQPKPDGGYYEPKNIVVDYVKKENKVNSNNNNDTKKQPDFLDDDLPF